MIGHLRGRILSRTPERLLLEVGGVGYTLNIPLSTYYEVEKSGDGAEIGLFVHTHVRDDVIALFGFWTEREKALFEKLLAVGGIGPRLAQVILSGMPPDDLLSALAAGDAVRLATIPGVGKKTAERMVVELTDRVAELAAAVPSAPATGPGDRDLVEALVNLGYRRSQAERAVAAVRHQHPEAEFADLLRLALKTLSRA